MIKHNGRPNACVPEGIGQKEAQAQAVMAWEETGIGPVSVKAARVFMEQGRIVLLFGGKKPSQTAGKQSRVQISERIVLGVQAAERLSVTLDAVIEGYEREFGALCSEKIPEGTTAYSIIE